eukprot:SAG31_NODE_46196_length_255_cov_0.993590_1_plen_27_part_10
MLQVRSPRPTLRNDHSQRPTRSNRHVE